MENKYELRKGGRLGPGKDDAKEILVLSRVIRHTSAGVYDLFATVTTGK